MKQDFSLSKKRLSLHVLLPVLLLFSLFTGCHEPFDDTDITNRLDELEKRIEKLEEDYQKQMDALQMLASMQEAITAIQISASQNAEDIEGAAGDIAGLREEIAALARALGTSDDKVAKALDELRNGIATVEETVANLGFTINEYTYDEETGKYKIVLSNGAVLELMARDNAVDAVRVKLDRDGRLYWEVNGEYLLDEGGNKIPISVTPAVRINPQTNEIEISVDGGTVWYPTGMMHQEEREEAAALFTSVTSDGTNVYFTMADGTVFTVALTSPEIRIVISSKKVYVMPGETKTLGITMQNVEKYILVKPDGWRASISDELMSLTAPEEGKGEETGYVQIFAVSKDGRSAIEEVKVVSGAPDVAVSVNEGRADIIVNERSASDETWLGYVFGIEVLSDGSSLEAVYEREAGKFNPETSGIIRESRTGIAIEDYVGPVQKNVDYLVWAIGIDRYKGEDGGWVTVLHSFEEMHHAIYRDEFKPVAEIVGLRENWTNGDLSIRPSWIGDEIITVMDQSAEYVFAARGLTDVDKVTFGVSEGAGIASMSALAVYPSGRWDSSVSDAGCELDVTYQSAQYAVDGSYDPNAYFAVAYNPDLSESNDFTFMNMPALLKFRASPAGQPIVRLKVTTIGGEAISGAMTVNVNGQSVAVSGKEESKNQAEIIAQYGFKAGTDYYLAVAPAVLSAGLSVCLNNDERNTYTISDITVLERNKVYDLGSFEYKVPEVEVPSDGENFLDGKQWIWRDVDAGCRRVMDFSLTEPGSMIIADNYKEMVMEGGSLPVDPVTGELGYDPNLIGKWVINDVYDTYTVTPYDETSGYITCRQTMKTIWGVSTSYFRIEYSDYTGTSVSLLSPHPFLDADGNKIPVLDVDGNPVLDISGYPLYWEGLLLSSPGGEEGAYLPIELTLATGVQELVPLQ